MGRLISCAQMAQAEKSLYADLNMAGFTLMRRAGRAVASSVCRQFPDKAKPVLVLCGPGNNGGDGYIVAQKLRERGYDVRLAATGPAQTKDAIQASLFWRGDVMEISAETLFSKDWGLVIDGLFGTGLDRAPGKDSAKLIAHINESHIPVLAIDIPSGVIGDSGEIPGEAFQAKWTVTFFRKKPGHLLFPGAGRAGNIIIADIGIKDSYLDEDKDLKDSYLDEDKDLKASHLEEDKDLKVSHLDEDENLFENNPSLWVFPERAPEAHKYHHGHMGVWAGPMAGAGFLASRAAGRMGVGLVSLLSDEKIQAGYSDWIMMRPVEDFSALMASHPPHVWVAGPGLTDAEEARRIIERLAGLSSALVIDAGGLTAFGDSPDRLWALLSKRPPCSTVLTPHSGEFSLLFPDLSGTKLERSRKAAQRSKAVILFKGADTIISSPLSARLVINSHAPAWLARAGSGDVLSGMVGALMARGMPSFEAAMAASWCHGETGFLAGEGLVADNLIEKIPEAFKKAQNLCQKLSRDFCREINA